jgi:threonyl-tRNA synthetase
VLPERLDASFVGEDGGRHRPVMLHRAVFGSFERFVGILIENYAGHLPLWMSPVQAVVATVVSEADDYAAEIMAKLKKMRLKAELDLRNEKINYKVRDHSLKKVPAILAVGKRDMDDGTVAVRRLGAQGQKTMTVDEAVAALAAEAVMP